MAAPVAPIMGASGRFYRNTGTRLAPVFDSIQNVRDIEAPISFTDVDVSSRRGGGFKQHEPALGDITLSITMLYDPADADMVTFIACATARKSVELAIMDQDILVAGVQGIIAVFKIFNMSRMEGVDGIMEQKFEFKLCYADDPPIYVSL